MARVLISMSNEFLDKVDNLANSEQRTRSELVREAAGDNINIIFGVSIDDNAALSEREDDYMCVTVIATEFSNTNHSRIQIEPSFQSLLEPKQKEEVITYKKSYLARLTLSSKTVLDNYNQVKKGLDCIENAIYNLLYYIGLMESEEGNAL